MIACVENDGGIVHWYLHDKTLVNRANAYWAYRHENGEIKVKRWVPIRSTQEPYVYLCDLCHAKEEKAAGNEFVHTIFPWPFIGSDKWDMNRVARQLFNWLDKGCISIGDPLRRFEDLT